MAVLQHPVVSCQGFVVSFVALLFVCIVAVWTFAIFNTCRVSDYDYVAPERCAGVATVSSDTTQHRRH